MSKLRERLEAAYMQAGDVSTGGLDRFSLTHGASIALDEATTRLSMLTLHPRTSITTRELNDLFSALIAELKGSDHGK